MLLPPHSITNSFTFFIIMLAEPTKKQQGFRKIWSNIKFKKNKWYFSRSICGTWNGAFRMSVSPWYCMNAADTWQRLTSFCMFPCSFVSLFGFPDWFVDVWVPINLRKQFLELFYDLFYYHLPAASNIVCVCLLVAVCQRLFLHLQ